MRSPRFAVPRAPSAGLPLLLALLACGDDDVPAPPADSGVEDAALDAAPPDDAGADASADAQAPACTFTATEEPVATPELYTPRWAFEPWISKDLSTTADTREFVAGFRERDIPVGVVVLDSPWETHYNTFVPNPDRYPDFATLLGELHDDDIRLVLWVTQMVNRSAYDLEPGGDTYRGPAPRWAEGRDCGFYVQGGRQYAWWKGYGNAVDFFHPGARAWWHEQQDPLLDLGLDGWKLDFGEQYITDDPIETHAGPVSRQAYSEEYYRDFWAYGVSRRGREFLTMVRPWDQSYQFEGRFYARPEHAPVAWVGDNQRDWEGLADALDHIFRSAAAGYTVVGSDVGGYLDRDEVDLERDLPFDSLVFARWTALGALTPFMQLHGRGNLAPWTVPDHADETVALYRYWATLHHELVPFFYSLAREAQPRGEAMLHPVGEAAGWPGDYRFLVGEALLVAPLLDATGRRDVELPDAGPWYDWWDPAAAPIDGPTVLRDLDATDRARIPLFVRAGAILPMTIEGDATGLGDATHAGALTVLVWPRAGGSRFVLHDEDAGEPVAIEADAAGADGTRAVVRLARVASDVLLRVRVDGGAAGGVALDGAPVPELADRRAVALGTRAAWAPDPASASVWVRVPARSGEAVVAVR